MAEKLALFNKLPNWDVFDSIEGSSTKLKVCRCCFSHSFPFLKSQNFSPPFSVRERKKVPSSFLQSSPFLYYWFLSYKKRCVSLSIFVWDRAKYATVDTFFTFPESFPVLCHFLASYPNFKAKSINWNLSSSKKNSVKSLNASSFAYLTLAFREKFSCTKKMLMLVNWWFFKSAEINV